MATEKQKEAVLSLVENGRSMTKGQILTDIGYSEAIATHPHKVFESKGVRELIEAGLAEGIDDTYTVKRLKYAMESDQHVVNALRLWFQTKYPQTKDGTTNIQNNYYTLVKDLNDEQLTALAEGDTGTPSDGTVGTQSPSVQA